MPLVRFCARDIHGCCDLSSPWCHTFDRVFDDGNWGIRTFCGTAGACALVQSVCAGVALITHFANRREDDCDPQRSARAGLPASLVTGRCN